MPYHCIFNFLAWWIAVGSTGHHVTLFLIEQNSLWSTYINLMPLAYTCSLHLQLSGLSDRRGIHWSPCHPISYRAEQFMEYLYELNAFAYTSWLHPQLSGLSYCRGIHWSPCHQISYRVEHFMKNLFRLNASYLCNPNAFDMQSISFKLNFNIFLFNFAFSNILVYSYALLSVWKKAVLQSLQLETMRSIFRQV